MLRGQLEVHGIYDNHTECLPSPPPRVRLGVDVGGTFTDIVSISESGDRYSVLKIPSTPSDPSVAVLSAIERILESEGEPEVAFLGHGTTAGTNAFLTKRGARTALVTTAGFEDVLEFRRMDRTGVLDPYDLQLRFPPPLVPRRLRLGVHERVGLGGVVIEPLRDEEIARVAGELAALGVDAVAIALLWAFEMPEHELRLRAAIEAALPGAFVTCSHEIDPTMMEYERTSTTVVNAYLGPLIQRYFAKVADEVERRGRPEPRIMQSNGGLASIRQAERRPAALLESGPAAGVAACGHIATAMGTENVLAVDMGGTSFDVALIVGGAPRQNMETEVEGYAVETMSSSVSSRLLPVASGIATCWSSSTVTKPGWPPRGLTSAWPSDEYVATKSIGAAAMRRLQSSSIWAMSLRTATSIGAS